MPWTETVLIYGVIPLAVVLLFAALTLIPGRGKEKTRYRPGEPWALEPVWYEPHPGVSGVHGGEHGDHAALGAGSHAADADIEGARRTAAGGARGTW